MGADKPRMSKAPLVIGWLPLTAVGLGSWWLIVVRE
jgi:hypothetical protein